jgi:hypothetical protein
MVTADAADTPGAIADGLVADNVNVGGITTAVTVTLAVPVVEA